MVSQKITPKPHLVLKTKLLAPIRGLPVGTKLFINVCTNDLVPLPPPLTPFTPAEDDVFDLSVILPKVMDDKWEIPILTSPDLRMDKDKSGNLSLVTDCVINDKPMNWCLISKDLMDILIDWCFESLEFQYDSEVLVVDHIKYSIPKMSYKGKEVQEMEIDLESNEVQRKEFERIKTTLTKNEPLGILESKRAQDEDDLDTDKQELTSLDNLLARPVAKPVGNGPLIQEINDMTISQSRPKTKLETSQNATKSPLQESKPKLSLDTKVVKLSPEDTETKYKLLLQISSNLTDKSAYKLDLNKENSTLLISTTDSKYDFSKSQVHFPLPIDTEQIRVINVNSEAFLRVYIK
ncbi:hypothetical protein LJB42_002993 [Komagataella kurtzmanii]|nr:hypothetical protein LJB42_002993 [Komagataella kurtzmanii]